MGPDMASAGTSLFVVQSTLGALYHKWRTGEGQRIDTSMLATMIHQRGITWTSMVDPDEWAGFYCEGYLKPPDNGYKTADQPVTLAAPRELSKFHEIMKALGMEEYLEHPLFQNEPRDILGWGGRGDQHVQAKPFWEEVLKTWKSEDLLRLFESLGSHGGQINTFRHLFAHPQMEAINMIKEIDDQKLGKMAYVVAPWKIEGLPKPSPSSYKSL